MVPQRMFYSLDSVPLMAGPFFVLAGAIMVKGKTAEYLIGFVKEIVCFIPGGLGVAAVVACGIFGAISGSANAALIAIGTILVPAIKETYKDDYLSVGLITVSSTVAIIIPPSIPMIIYAALAELSIGRLFLGGFGPGVLIVILLSIYAYIYGVKKNLPTTQISRFKIWTSFKKATWALSLPVIVLGSIYTGVATPTEAAVISVFYSLFIEICIYREMKLKDLKNILIDSAFFCGAIFIIVASASAMASYLIVEQIPLQIAQAVFQVIKSKFLFLLFVNVFLLIIGCLMDIISATLIFVPLFMKFAEIYQINPYHFALIFLVNMDIGYYTPPVGLNIFVASMLFKMPVMKVVKYGFPAFLVMLVALALVTYFPDVTLYLIRLLMPF